MPFFPNLNLKRVAEEEARRLRPPARRNSCWLLEAFKTNIPLLQAPSPPPPSPLSLCFPLPQPFSTITKACSFVTINCLLGPLYAALDVIPDSLVRQLNVALTVVITSELLACCMLLSGKNDVLVMLMSKVNRLFPTWLCRGKCMRDEVAQENLPSVNWEILPSELWEEIGKRLPSRLDILRFRSVCMQWRSSLPPPNRFPLRIPLPPNCDPEFRKVSYFITEVNCYSLDQRGRYKMLFEGVDQGGKCYRGTNISPLKGKFKYRMISLMGTPKLRPSQIYFSSKAFRLRMALPRSNSNKERLVVGGWDFQYSKFAKKMLIVSSSNVYGVNPNYVRLSDLSVVVHMSWGNMKGRLALLRLGGSPENWEWDTNFCTQYFEDIATYRGQLCTLDRLGRVFLMDYDSLEMTQVAPPWSIPSEMGNKHLYEAHGDLILLNLSRKRSCCVAYKLSLPLQKWIQVKGRDMRVYALLPFLEKEGVQERAESQSSP